MTDQWTKLARARDIIRDLRSVVVAFSGGVDSTFLLALCLQVLGADRVLAVTATSETYPQSELEESRQLASALGARQHLIRTNELADPRFANNPPDRCYFCRQSLMQQLWGIAQHEGLQCVVYGANVDDLGDYRPGMNAARESGARAPLLEAGLTKQEVRLASREMGLPIWNKPAMACLSSRVPYGIALTPAVLKQVEAAEEFLRREIGLRQFRVRHHPPIARLEIPAEDWDRVLLPETRQRIVSRLRELGYLYVTIDLDGFRSGSLNDALKS